MKKASFDNDSFIFCWSEGLFYLRILKSYTNSNKPREIICKVLKSKESKKIAEAICEGLNRKYQTEIADNGDDCDANGIKRQCDQIMIAVRENNPWTFPITDYYLEENDNSMVLFRVDDFTREEMGAMDELFEAICGLRYITIIDEKKGYSVIDPRSIKIFLHEKEKTEC